MPNRILKESICTSDTIDKLSPFEETLFYRLIVNVDDYGRLDARVAILKSRLFPLKKIADRLISESINRLAQIGAVYLYECDGAPYLQLVNWGKHQSIKQMKGKYPPPPKEVCASRELEIMSEGDVEERLMEFFSTSGNAFGYKLSSLDRQMRIGSSYIDLIARTEAYDFIIELKRNRISNKAIDQLLSYLDMASGEGVLIGAGLAVNFDKQRCVENNIAVITYDGDLNFSLIVESDVVKQCDITLNNSQPMSVTNPIRIQSESNTNPNPIQSADARYTEVV